MQAGWSLALLYLASFLSWGGTLTQHCPMGDAQALGVHTILSAPIYLIALPLLSRTRLNVVLIISALPIVSFMIWQFVWGLQMFDTANIRGLSPCTLIMQENYGSADESSLDVVYGPYYIMTSFTSLIAIAFSYWRFRQEQNKSI